MSFLVLDMFGLRPPYYKKIVWKRFSCMNEQFDHWNYFVTIGQTNLGKNKMHNKLFGKQARFWPKIYILPTYSVILLS